MIPFGATAGQAVLAAIIGTALLWGAAAWLHPGARQRRRRWWAKTPADRAMQRSVRAVRRGRARR